MADTDRKNGFISPTPDAYNSGEGGSMVRHIDAELQGLKDLTLQMGNCVEIALENACNSVLGKNCDKCQAEVGKHESRINDLQIRIDESCVNVLAKQAPVAKDLRLVIAITKINTDLERMGDQSVNISRSACDLYGAWPEAQLPPQLNLMIREVRAMVRSVLDAFSRRDVELSEKVLKQDDFIDGLRDTLIRETKDKMKAGDDQIETGLAYIMIAKNLERMADHATNIAEEVIYLATGNDVRHGHIVTANS